LEIPISKGIEILFHHRGDPQKNKNGIDDLIHDIPILNTYVTLRVHINKQFGRDIQPNDLFDISFLCLCIPYCDIVLCDKFFTAAIHSTHLDSNYNTFVGYKLSELEEIL